MGITANVAQIKNIYVDGGSGSGDGGGVGSGSGYGVCVIEATRVHQDSRVFIIKIIIIMLMLKRSILIS